MSEKMVVIGESNGGTLRNVTFEAIAATKKIAADGEVVGVLCVDSEQDDWAQEMIHYGADRVITVKSDALNSYTATGFTQALMPVLNDEKPDTIVMGHTAIGKDLTPKIANRLGIGLISDVIEIVSNANRAEFIRPIYAGKAYEKKIITDEVKFITIRPNNIAPLEKDVTHTGDVIHKEANVTNILTTIKDVIRKKADGVDLTEAKVVVSGGRGVKSADGFKPLEELADLLGGAVGASRGACDADYCDYSLQIGQTGKVVTPDLYIACGISGAIQHLAGMSNSKVIVAINKDPEANIFNVADYGIVGDIFDVLPKLIDEIKALKQIKS